MDHVAVFAPEEDIEQGVQARLQGATDKKDRLASLLGEAVEALLEINRDIPARSPHRHLVAGALERFARAKGN